MASGSSRIGVAIKPTIFDLHGVHAADCAVGAQDFVLARLEDVDRVGRYAGLDHRHIWHPLVMDSGGRGGHAQCHIKRHKVKQRLSNSRNDARTPGASCGNPRLSLFEY